MNKNALKGFRALVLIKEPKKKEPKEKNFSRRMNRILVQLSSGKVRVSKEKKQYRYLATAPSLTLDRIVQALKWGATPDEVRFAAEETLTELSKIVDWKKATREILYFAESKKVAPHLIAEVLGLPRMLSIAAE